MNRVELMPLVTTYQGTGNLGICSVDCCKASSCQDLWLIPIFPKSAESGCGMWARTGQPGPSRAYLCLGQRVWVTGGREQALQYLQPRWHNGRGPGSGDLNRSRSM